MRGIEIHRWSANLLLVVALLVSLGTGQAWAQESEMKDGGIEPGRFYLGIEGWFRAPHAAIDAWHINCRWLAREFSGHVQSQQLAIDWYDA